MRKKQKQAIITISLALVVTAASGAMSARVSAAPAMAGYWKFDEPVAGSNAHDSSGNNNDGIPGNDDGFSLPSPSTNVPPSISFTDPYSAEFNGDDYYEINRPVQDDFTICAWVNTTSAGNGPNHWETAPIMDSEVGGVTNDFGFGIAVNGTLAYGDGNAAGNSDIAVDGNTIVNDGTWHQVCVSKDSVTGAVVLYVDAQVDGTGVTNPGRQDANPYARIGYGYDGAALFNGLIDDARAYPQVLTAAQIANLYAGSNDPTTPPVVTPVSSPASSPAPTSPATPVPVTVPNTGIKPASMSAILISVFGLSIAGIALLRLRRTKS